MQKIKFYTEGASTVKYIEKMLQYIKTINLLVKRLKIIEKFFIKIGISFHDALYCYVRYSNIKHQDEISKTYQ